MRESGWGAQAKFKKFIKLPLPHSQLERHSGKVWETTPDGPSDPAKICEYGLRVTLGLSVEGQGGQLRAGSPDHFGNRNLAPSHGNNPKAITWILLTKSWSWKQV